MPTIRFTDAAIKALKPTDGKQVDYTCATIKAFILRVNQGGGKSWWVRYGVIIGYEDGKPVWKRKRQRLGAYPKLSLQQARDKADGVLTLADAGQDPAATTAKISSLAALGQRYLEEWAKVRKKSWQEDARIIKAYIEPAFGNKNPEHITRSEIKAWLRQMMQRGPYMANRSLAVLKKIYTWANDEEYVESNPSFRVKSPGKETPRDRVLNHKEIRLLYELLAERGGVSDLAALMTLLKGQRSVEVRNMRTADIEDQWWTIPAAIAKNGQAHRVYLTDWDLEHVEVAKAAFRVGKVGQASDYVYPSPTKIGAAVGANSQGWKRIKLAAEKIPDFQLKDLRRTLGTTLASLGVRKEIRKACMNHVEGDVHDRHYDRYEYDAEKRAAFQLYSDHLQSIVSGGKGVAKVVAIGT